MKAKSKSTRTPKSKPELPERDEDIQELDVSLCEIGEILGGLARAPEHDGEEVDAAVVRAAAAHAHSLVDKCFESIDRIEGRRARP